MILGFLGTGKIASSVITGICNSKIKYKKIIISPRNKIIANSLKKKFNKINDSITLLEQSDLTWKEILISNKIKRIKQVSVVLYDLEPLESAQTNFFQYLNNNFENTIKKRNSLSDTIDVINSKFGRDSITIGSLPKNISDFSGTKVAFTRIPDIKEFYE